MSTLGIKTESVVIQVEETGEGIHGSPYRLVKNYYTMDGTFIGSLPVQDLAVTELSIEDSSWQLSKK